MVPLCFVAGSGAAAGPASDSPAWYLPHRLGTKRHLCGHERRHGMLPYSRHPALSPFSVRPPQLARLQIQNLFASAQVTPTAGTRVVGPVPDQPGDAGLMRLFLATAVDGVGLTNRATSVVGNRFTAQFSRPLLGSGNDVAFDGSEAVRISRSPLGLTPWGHAKARPWTVFVTWWSGGAFAGPVCDHGLGWLFFVHPALLFQSLCL